MEGANEAVTTNLDHSLTQIDPKIFQSTKDVTKWIDQQDEHLQSRLAEVIFQTLLQSAYDAASSPSTESPGNCCIILCGFVQHCTKARQSRLARWAFQESVAVSLFDFYIKSHDNDPHRSLRLILDILAIMIKSNPNPDVGSVIKNSILGFLIPILVHKSTRPLAKPCLHALNVFINKYALSLDDISRMSKDAAPSKLDGQGTWDLFMSRLLSWMDHPNLCPIVGKVVVQIYCGLRELSPSSSGPDVNDPSSFVGAATLRRWLQEAAASNPSILEDTKHYVLKPLFKASRASSLELLRLCNETGAVEDLGSKILDTNLFLQLAVLEVGKKADLIDEPGDNVCLGRSSPTIKLQVPIVQNLLTYPSLDVRSSAFALLVSSQSSTKPLSSVVLDLVKGSLSGFYSEHDAKFRNDVLAYSKDLIGRVKGVIVVAKRALSRPTWANGSPHPEKESAEGLSSKKRFGPEANLKSDEEATETLKRHTELLRWLQDFLKGELIPTASYQRHITALKITTWLLRKDKYAGVSSDDVDSDVVASIAFDPAWTRLILDLVMDPFDDVREAAVAILAMFPPSIIEAAHRQLDRDFTLFDVLSEFCSKAHDSANKTGRADYGNGAARSEGLLCSWSSTKRLRIEQASAVLQRLEQKISDAERDLGHAAIEKPVHGDFSSLNYIWQVLVKDAYVDSELDAVHDIQSRIVACSKRVWVTVKHVLCDDSPEGHLPEELEEIDGLDTRDLLSYSFRAVHESSNLLRLLAATLSVKSKPGMPYPTFDVFKDIGNLTFEQLSNLRHRGAFSTVSYTFTTCCQLTQNSGHVFPNLSDSSDILRGWYTGTLSCVMNQASTTRRSAGIPALMMGILAANSKSPCMKEIFETLGDISKKPASVADTDGSNLPQVHALNCLKDVFRSSLLSKRADGYLTETLQLAAISLKSEVWAIRNCGLMLFRSLIDALFSTKDSKHAMELGWDGQTTQISYTKYPALPSVLLDLLRSGGQILEGGSQIAGAEAVFPVLDIIRRAGPPEEHRGELYTCIKKYLGSHIWHVREIAARTLCSFLLRADWVREVESLILESLHDTNRLHGSLLALKFVLERKAGLGDAAFIEEAKKIQSAVRSRLFEYSSFRTCAEIRATYLEVHNLIWRIKIPTETADSTGSIGSSQEVEDARELELAPTYSALLDVQGALRTVHELITNQNLEELAQFVLSHLTRNANTACKLLEDIPRDWESAHGNAFSPELCSLFVEACTKAEDPTTRAQALTSLSGILTQGLEAGKLDEMPPNRDLVRLWEVIRRGAVNPTLSWAILEASGQLMAIMTSRDLEHTYMLETQLKNWGDMMSDALDADNSFDTRFAAVMALKSFAKALGTHLTHPVFLPCLSAIYDALNDDDYEVRDLAATATVPILGRSLAAFEAAEALVRWLPGYFGQLGAYRWQVVRRMSGQSGSGNLDVTCDGWTPAETQLRKAMRVDDSLFAVEEQNLFIDEVRETTRWRQVFLDLKLDGDEAPVQCLRSWTEAGMQYMVRLAETAGDGPLGWTSDQHVFALCARILLCATAMSASEQDVMGFW